LKRKKRKNTCIERPKKRRTVAEMRERNAELIETCFQDIQESKETRKLLNEMLLFQMKKLYEKKKNDC